MPEPLEYITKDALIECDQGVLPMPFTPTYNLKHKVNGCMVATAADMIPLLNIPSFKMCKITQKPCVPAPTMWDDTFDVKVMSQRTLVGQCSMKCAVGGTMSFLMSGQVPLPLEAQNQLADTLALSNQKLEESGNTDAVGETGFWEGMIPVWGSGRDFINSVQTGNIGGAILNGGFLIWDVASIALGAVSFGAGTALMQGIKAAGRAAVRKLSWSAIKEVGQRGLQYFSKESIENLLSKASHIIVTGCFPAGTLIHAKNGVIPIEQLEMGIEVLAFNEADNIVSYKKVVAIISKENMPIMCIKVESETIYCTPNHPFWLNNQWIQAKELKAGQKLTNYQNKKIEIISVDYLDNLSTVYNFEVELWHNYFVGEIGILVHNARPCLRRIKHLPGWLKRIEKGRYFDFIRGQTYARKGGYNEVVLDTFKRLDSYIPNKEIVSRKFTQLGNVAESTAKKYIDELATKYKPGTKIRNTPRNADAIAQSGGQLKGKMILEVPKQNGNISQSILNHAKDRDVLIRDISGKILNP